MINYARLEMSNWKEVKCKCGFTPTDNPKQYEKYDMEVCKSLIFPEYQFAKKTVLRCTTCKEISTIEREIT